MKINIRFRFIIATISLMISDVILQTSQNRLDNTALLHTLHKDTTQNSSVEKRAQEKLPFKRAQSPQSTGIQSQTPERSFIHFPKNLLKTQSTNSTIRSSQAIKVTPNSRVPKLPKLMGSKVISNSKTGQSANIQHKVKSGQLSSKLTPENLQARRTPTDTKLVSDPYTKLNKTKPVLQRISFPIPVAATTKNPFVAFPKQGANNMKRQNFQLLRKSNETDSQSSINTLKISHNATMPRAIRQDRKDSRSLNSPQVVPKFKNLIHLSRSRHVVD